MASLGIPPVEAQGQTGRRTHHILLGKGDCLAQSAFVASALYASKLHRLFPSVFSSMSVYRQDMDADMITDMNTNITREEEGVVSNADIPLPPSSPLTVIHRGYPGLTVHLLPVRVAGLDASTLALRGEEVSGGILRGVEEMWEGVAGQVGGLIAGVEDERKRVLRATEGLIGHVVGEKESGSGLDNESPYATTAAVTEREGLRDFDEREALLLRAASEAVTFLGTGCAQPSKYRNVSGILLQVYLRASHYVIKHDKWT